MMLSISRSTVDCNRPRRSSPGANCIVPDEDLRGQNIVLLQSTVLREIPDIIADISAIATNLYHILDLYINLFSTGLGSSFFTTDCQHRKTPVHYLYFLIPQMCCLLQRFDNSCHKKLFASRDEGLWLGSIAHTAETPQKSVVPELKLYCCSFFSCCLPSAQ